MALGNIIAEFSLKLTSFTYFPGPDTTATVQVNCEGEVDGFGSVLGTWTSPAGAKSSGRWSWCGVSYPATGEGLTGHAEGTFASNGTNKWQTRGINHLSDGRTLAMEGEIDIASRTWSGQLHDWS